MCELLLNSTKLQEITSKLTCECLALLSFCSYLYCLTISVSLLDTCKFADR